MTLEVQFWTLVMMVAGGNALGAIYDLFRVVHQRLRMPRLAYIPIDITYWILSTILIFSLLYSSNQGQLRLFVFIGMASGVLIYYFLLSKPTTRLFNGIMTMIASLYKFAVKMVQLLIIKPLIGLYRALVVFLGFLTALAIFLYKIMLQLLYPFWALILWVKRRFFK